MRIIYADEKLQLNNSVVILGNFDGVHIAHQSLIKQAVGIAKSKGFTSVIYTFSEHPKKILQSEVEIITTNSEKEKIFNDLGVDVLVYQYPDKDFLSLLPEDFITKTLIDSLAAKVIVVGEHYSFGYKASGKSNFLKEFSKKFGVDTHIMPLVFDGGEIVSSSNIRDLISCGEIKLANKLLGREFEISGKVEHGNSVGSKIGFPTANVNLKDGKVVPKYGVYACKALIDDKEYNAVVNIGVKPTFNGKIPLAEVHLFNVSDNFYGKKITIKLCEFIREESKFNGFDSLKQQIEFDVKTAKEYFLYNSK